MSFMVKNIFVFMSISFLQCLLQIILVYTFSKRPFQSMQSTAPAQSTKALGNLDLPGPFRSVGSVGTIGDVHEQNRRLTLQNEYLNATVRALMNQALAASTQIRFLNCEIARRGDLNARFIAEIHRLRREAAMKEEEVRRENAELLKSLDQALQNPRKRHHLQYLGIVGLDTLDEEEEKRERERQEMEREGDELLKECMAIVGCVHGENNENSETSKESDEPGVEGSW